jgi:hypothetical protein
MFIDILEAPFETAAVCTNDEKCQSNTDPQKV